MLDKVCFLMAVYHLDKIEFLKQSINSVLNQDYPNFEVVIVADGTLTPELEYYLNKKANECPNLHLISGRNERRGLAYSLNEGINYILKNIDARFIARMDSDDISQPSRLSRQVKYMRTENVDVSGTACLEIDSNGVCIDSRKVDTSHSRLFFNIIKRCPFVHPSVIISISIFKSGYRYDSKLKNSQDYELWVRLARDGYIFGNIDEPLIYFRRDENFFSRRSYNKSFNELKSKFFAMKSLSLFTVSNVTISILLFVLRLMPEVVSKFAYKNFR